VRLCRVVACMHDTLHIHVYMYMHAREKNRNKNHTVFCCRRRRDRPLFLATNDTSMVDVLVSGPTEDGKG
jgi:hypothetical protein